METVGARVEQSTLSGYERDIRLRIKPSIGDARLVDLQPAHIADMLSELRKPGSDQRQKHTPKPLTETTLQHTFDTLRAGLNWAVKSRLLGYNPALDVDRPQRGAVELRRVIDVDSGTVEVLRLWGKVQDCERVDWAEAYEDSGAVFTNENGTKLYADRIAQAYDRWCDKAPVPTIRFHDLRHTHASLLLAQGVPVVDVAYRLGDTPETILSTYAHFIPGQGQATAALFAQMADGETEERRTVDGE